MKFLPTLLLGAALGIWAYHWWLDRDPIPSRAWSFQLLPAGVPDRWTNVGARWVGSPLRRVSWAEVRP